MEKEVANMERGKIRINPVVLHWNWRFSVSSYFKYIERVYIQRDRHRNIHRCTIFFSDH